MLYYKSTKVKVQELICRRLSGCLRLVDLVTLPEAVCLRFTCRFYKFCRIFLTPHALESAQLKTTGCAIGGAFIFISEALCLNFFIFNVIGRVVYELWVTISDRCGFGCVSINDDTAASLGYTISSYDRFGHRT